MPNAYFRFQQFTVRQERCAMKVCTDACLFGGWLARKNLHARRILDVGAGTGLLSLMLAQYSAAFIDAVEIDSDASVQAAENFLEAPWANRLRCIHSSIQDYAARRASDNARRYDLIVSNPPFFSNDLKSADSKRNLAFHGETLSLKELTGAVQQLLVPGGFFAVIVPCHRAAHLEQVAAHNGLFVSEKVNVRQTLRHTSFRSMYLFCNEPVRAVPVEELVIKSDHQKYTTEFSEIMEDYYLLPDNALP